MLYELPHFEHIDVRSLKEAVFWLRTCGEKARLIGGGTDLLGLMKDRVEGPALPMPEVLVNIKTISRLKRITYDEKKGLKIGAAVTLNRLNASGTIKRKFNILLQAVRQVGTTQIRNMGTLGGNLCQRPQCMYFRHPHFRCYKKGGSRCFAIKGEHRDHCSILEYGKCVMAHPSDMAPALVALKAQAIIVGDDGVRQIPLEDLFLGANHFRETVLKPDELLVEVLVANQGGRTFQLFLKHRIRGSSDFALSSVAVVARVQDEVCEDIRIVLGGVAPFPYIASEAEETLRGRRLGKKLVLRAAEASVERAHSLPMNRYKIDLTRALVGRVLISICNELR